MEKLREAGVTCSSVTSDGKRSTVSAVKSVYPDIPHQRCIIHVHRYASARITRRPRTQAGKEIQLIAHALLAIRTHEDKERWLVAYQYWCGRWEEFLKEKSCGISQKTGQIISWFTHKSLRAVRTHLNNALPHLFHYLDDKNISKDTNGLEGRFSSFKQHYRQHRGLSPKRRKGYIAWYITVIVNKDSPTRNGY